MVVAGDSFNSKPFRAYQDHKQHKQKILERDTNLREDTYIEQKYFNCLYCNKVNYIEDIVKERSDNRTVRSKYMTWKKFKDISNEIGGDLENGLNYLISLHEQKKYHRIKTVQEGRRPDSDDYSIGVAGFGKQYGDKEK